ncbi:MAG: hypothetical protein Q4A66_07970, partial [Eubacteriales bacterium]|nr:hypothetical protein [Eubacteriales bacterium]
MRNRLNHILAALCILALLCCGAAALAEEEVIFTEEYTDSYSPYRITYVIGEYKNVRIKAMSADGPAVISIPLHAEYNGERYTVVGVHSSFSGSPNANQIGYIKNYAAIDRGTFNAPVYNFGAIIGGTFRDTVTNGGGITGGTFNDIVSNMDVISGGTFNATVSNNAGGTISGGKFTKRVLDNGGVIAPDAKFTHSVNGTDAALTFGGNLIEQLNAADGNSSSAVRWYAGDALVEAGDTADIRYTAYTSSSPAAYDIGTRRAEHGEVLADKTSASEGEVVTLILSPADGYHLSSLTVTNMDDAEEDVMVTGPHADDTYSFVMPAHSVTVTAAFAQTTAPVYEITVNRTVNGTLDAHVENAAAGTEIILTVDPDENYQQASLTVTKTAAARARVVTTVEGNTFIMPDHDVTVSATFALLSGDGWNLAVDESGDTYMNITGALSSLPTDDDLDYSDVSYIQIDVGGSVSDGEFHHDVVNKGSITGGTFGKLVKNSGVIKGSAVFAEGSWVKNYGSIEGGTFRDQVDNTKNAKISGGAFENVVMNREGEISGGVFYDLVTNSDGAIKGGTFHGELACLYGTVSAGTFHGEVYSMGGVISGGSFTHSAEDAVQNFGTVTGGSFNCEVENSGLISGGSFSGANADVDNNIGGAIEGGTFGCEVENEGGAITGGTFHGIRNESGTVQAASGKALLCLEGVYDFDPTQYVPEVGYGITQSDDGTYAVAHVCYGEYVYNNDATCTADGTETRTCPCGETDTRTAVGTAGHDYQRDVARDVAPTCTADGLEAYTCARCGGTQDQVLPAAHSVLVTPGKAPTCTETGLTEGKVCTACGHVFSEQRVLDVIPHEAAILPMVIPTCSATGLTEGSVCGVCGLVLEEQRVIPKEPHAAVVFMDIEPTCSEFGMKGGMACSVCGEVLAAGEVVEKLPHSEVVVPGKKATCTEAGLTDGKVCAVCGEVLVEQKVIGKLLHIEKIVPGKAATCTEAGLTAGKVCAVCGEVLAEQKVIG